VIQNDHKCKFACGTAGHLGLARMRVLKMVKNGSSPFQLFKFVMDLFEGRILAVPKEQKPFYTISKQEGVLIECVERHGALQWKV
jgi:hypothetical protein